MKGSKNLNLLDIENIVALTPTQEGMLFHYLQNPSNGCYFEQLCVEISGKINRDIFEKSWNFVIKTNEILRTFFRWEKIPKPVHVILKEHQVKPAYYDFSKENPAERNQLYNQVRVQDSKHGFDLSKVPFRVTLCKMDKKTFVMVISNHHILYDGWSTGIILNEFFRAYETLARCDGDISAPPVKTRFNQFIKWLGNRNTKEQEKFWKSYLKGLDTGTVLSGKKSTGTGVNKLRMVFNEIFNEKLDTFTRRNRITAGTFFYTAWGLLLQRYCNSSDVVFGTTVSGRTSDIKGIEDMVGLFINTPPLRVGESDAKSGTENIKELLTRINYSLHTREKFESTSLTKIKEYSEIEKNGVFFDNIVVIENYPLDRRISGKTGSGSLRVDSYTSFEMTNYNLTVAITFEDVISVEFIYVDELFEKSFLQGITGHFSTITENMLNEPGKEVNRIEVLSEEERNRILYEFNDIRQYSQIDKTIHGAFAKKEKQTPDHISLIVPKVQIPNVGTGSDTYQTALENRCHKTLHALFEEQVERTPDSIAVTGPVPGNNHQRNCHITYNELNERSDRLASYLGQKGVMPGSIIGIAADRSLEMIVGLLGILKAGAAYLPIDPGYPPERIRFMLKDGNVGILLTTPGLSAEITFEKETVLIPNAVDHNRLPAPVSVPVNSLSYVIYTSGSTGNPKGVAIEHQSIVNTLYWRKKCYGFDSGDSILQLPSFSFDSSVEDIFTSLISGSRLVMIHPQHRFDIDYLKRKFLTAKVTHFLIAPALYKTYLHELYPSLTRMKSVTIAGEHFTEELVNQHFEKLSHVKLYNEYGPTENSVCSTMYQFQPGKTKVLIGKPISNVMCFILNKNKQLSPVEIPGELFLAGKGIARGYLNQPELTAETFDQRFLDFREYRDKKNKEKESTGATSTHKDQFIKLYKTGDLARWLPDGNIEFLGRVDSQIKLRGYRIELGEIENWLLKHPEVKETVVVIGADKSGDKYICAYYVPVTREIVSHKEPGLSNLRDYLLKNIPAHMVPSYFVPIETVPLTPNGKIDRKLLPQPKSGSTYTGPRNPLEEKLVEIWAEVLRVDKTLGIDDNFFQLGGHSLKATLLISKIHKSLNVKIPLTELFKHPTIRGISGIFDEVLKSGFADIEAVEKREYYPLSSAQKRLYFLQVMNPESTGYNMPIVLPLHEGVEKDKLESALKRLVARHESLRTSFIQVADEPMQKIYDHVEFKIDRIEKSSEYGIENDIFDNFVRPFDLSIASLFRAGLATTGKDRYILLVDMHHIISDGISADVLRADFNSLYNGQSLPPVRIQYKDFAQWQTGEAETKNIKNQETYWLNKFEGEVPVLDLPLDYPRPLVRSFDGDGFDFKLSVEESGVLRSVALKTGSSLFMVLLALTNILLAKLSGQEDVIIGTPVAGRRHADLEKIIGMFVNTLALRNFPIGRKTVKDFLTEVKEQTLDAFEKQEYPFEELVHNLDIQRDVGRNPLFDVMFSLADAKTVSSAPIVQSADGLEELSHRISKFDLSLAVENGAELSFAFEYSKALFRKKTIQRFSRYFKEILYAVIQDIEVKICNIEILSKEEKKQLLVDFNNSVSEYSKDKFVHQLFQQQVEKTPYQVAVKFKNNDVTYTELNGRANYLAQQLREKGIRPDTIVGIVADRGVEMLVGILGVLKAGGAYLPIDPVYPESRIQFMLADSQSSLVLVTHGLEGRIVGCNIPVREIHSKPPVDLKWDIPNPDPVNEMKNLAYVVYTSGSTGKPKGVMVEHRNIIAYLNAFYRVFEITSDDTFIQQASLSFDAFVEEVFPILLRGGKLAIPHRDEILDLERLSRFLIEQEVTIISCSPLLLNELNKMDDIGSVRLFISGGDVLKAEYINNLCKDTEVYNTYGPTESTIDATCYRCSINESLEPPIGKPFSNYSVYILDSYGGLLPVGIAGELYIGGAGVARGYLNRPELTAEKFSRDFLNDRHYRSIYKDDGTKKPLPGKNDRLYRTGDLVHWMPDGNLRFLGRIDHQVKIRGYRIELGEVENWLLKYPEVREAVVVTRADKSGDKYICAYYTTATGETVSGKEPDQSGVRDYLLKNIPAYMVPSYFVPIETIPLTPNGKINRNLLPHPKPVSTYTAPRNPLEEKLVDIWTEVLGSDKALGIDDNFFQFGGHSLKATILISKIHKNLNVKVPLTELFKHQTIRELSGIFDGAIKSRFAGIEAVEKKEYYPLSSAQKRLYFLQVMNPKSTGYNMPLVLSLGKEVDKNKLESVLKRLIARHESLRTSFIQVENEPMQRVHDDVKFKIQYYDSAAEKAKSFAPVIPEILSVFVHPFDLDQSPLIRSGLIKLPDNQHIWIVDIHHIISDGTSSAILTADFKALYKGEELVLLKLQYKDFSQWQNRLFSSGEIKAQEEYWLELYTDSGEIPRLQLPCDYQRPEVFSFTGDNYHFMLTKETSEAFKSLAFRNGATLYMNVLAILNTLFHVYTNQTDIILGTGIAGRRHTDLQGIMGMFVNTLAMRNYPQPEKTYESFLQEVAAQSVKAFENQDVQFEDLVNKLEPERDPSRNPLFDVSMVVQNFRNSDAPGPARENSNLAEIFSSSDKSLSHIKYQNSTAKFDMTFFIYESVENIYITIEYYTGIFKEESIKRLAGHLKNIIQQVIDTPSIPLKDIDFLIEEEKRQLLYTFNDTAREYPKDKTIHGLFEDQVDKTPDQISLVYENEYLSYSQLDERADQLADYLYAEQHILSGEGIGILMNRSIDRVVAVLGILKAGGAYVPIDPSFPEARIKYIIDDVGVRLLISQKQYIRTLNHLQWECPSLRTFLCMDSLNISEEDETEQNQLMDEKLWEYIGETATDEITGGGWLSSYTGEPIARKEMDEYGDNILKKLLPILHKDIRVLEIGCASGISMFRIAPIAGFYFGTDLSHIIIQKNQERIKKEGYQNIALACLPAHEIDRIPEKDFDLIIINSVIQAFQGHNYLRKVIKKSIRLLNSQGSIFVGDVMDLDKKTELIADLIRFKKENKNENHTTKTDFSTELFLSKAFWNNLALKIDAIEHIEFSDKIHTIENELTRFRYDALININKLNRTDYQLKTGTKLKTQEDFSDILRSGTSRPNESSINSGNLAYIIYTSGTTGNPKGVMVEHRGIANLKTLFQKDYKVNGWDNIIQFANLSFDASVWETFMAILNGASLHLLNERVISDYDKFHNYLVSRSITVATLPPPYAVHLNVEQLSVLRLLITAGSPPSIEFINKCRKYFSYINAYGPTENSVCSSYWRSDEEAAGVRITIGKPIRNTRLYILNKATTMLQPIGVTGELCIDGEGLARGYLNKVELTRQKFIDNPFTKGRKLYRSGDLSRWLVNGNIEFLGRIDQQVKIRGIRIEPGEIQYQLRKIDSIKDAVVIEQTDNMNETCLCAYIVSDSNVIQNFSDLKLKLASKLPEYMVPAYFVVIDRIPLTTNGKVDRKALPKPTITTDQNFIAARTPVETRLIEIWSQLLGLSDDNGLPIPIDIDTDFFKIGGHSLNATVLVSRIQKELNVKIPLMEVFKTPTVRELAEYVKTRSTSNFKAIQPVEKKEYYPVSSAQKRMFILNRLKGNNTSDNTPQAVSVEGDFSHLRLQFVMQQMIKRHEVLRTSFKEINDIPVQHVHDYRDINFSVNLREARGDDEVDSIIKSFIHPFDLSKAPLIRVELIKLTERKHILLVDIHHIIIDGPSLAIFINEFFDLYSGKKLPEFNIHYKDFSDWHNRLLRSDRIKSQEEYWLKQFEGQIPSLDMPTDFPRPKFQSFEGDYVKFRFPQALTDDIKRFISHNDVTLFMVLLSVYTILLSKYSGQEDIVVGTPIAGRVHTDLEHLIGMMANTLALRNFPLEDKTYLDFLGEVKTNALNAYENQDYQFEHLVEQLDIKT